MEEVLSREIDRGIDARDRLLSGGARGRMRCSLSLKMEKFCMFCKVF